MLQWLHSGETGDQGMHCSTENLSFMQPLDPDVLMWRRCGHIFIWAYCTNQQPDSRKFKITKTRGCLPIVTMHKPCLIVFYRKYLRANIFVHLAALGRHTERQTDWGQIDSGAVGSEKESSKYSVITCQNWSTSSWSKNFSWDNIWKQLFMFKSAGSIWEFDVFPEERSVQVMLCTNIIWNIYHLSYG